MFTGRVGLDLRQNEKRLDQELFEADHEPLEPVRRKHLTPLTEVV
jgi:hypothetical protein